MKNALQPRKVALVAALAAITATAWAANESLNSVYIPGPAVHQERPVYSEVERSVAAGDPIVAKETLDANETVVTTVSERPVVIEERAVVVAEAPAPQPPITIEERRLTEDERIQAVVMDRLASNPRLSGKIGVESRDARVILTGYTSTVGQAQRAGREASGVAGVKAVDNRIRARVGGSVA